MLLSRDFIRMSFLFAIFIKKTKCPRSFKQKGDLYKWFADNRNQETELWVGYYKVGTGKTSV